jgi:hypothetical protein
MAVVSVRCSWGRGAVSMVCRALEPLRLGVVTATIAAAGDTVVHTMFVEVSSLQRQHSYHPATSKLFWLPASSVRTASGRNHSE